MIGKVICIVVSIFILGNLAWEALSYQKAKRSVNWKSAEGRIDEVKIYDKSSPSAPFVYHFKIKYSYDVLGKTYHSDRYAFGFDFHNHDSNFIETLHDSYKGKSTLKIFYDEHEPSESTVLTGTEYIGRKFWFNLFIQFFMVGLIVFFIFNIDFLNNLFKKMSK
jgi:hypothetical protein